MDETENEQPPPPQQYRTSRLLRKQSNVVSKKVCAKEERNASIKKISVILQKAEDDRSTDELEMLRQNADTVKEIISRRKKRDEVKRRVEEFEDPVEELEQKCQVLAQAIAQSRHLVVYTGAGISTAARIPDYRGTNGIWTRLQQGKDIGNHDLSLAEPTYTHMALYELYRQNILKYVVSQNCDGLHLRSGLPRNALSEVHGNMYIEVCKACKPIREYWRLFDVTEHTGRYSHRTMRRCYSCNGPLEDTIVHFGERGKLQWPLNWAGASKNARSATTILCLGSSLKVLKKYPWLWQMHKPPKRRPNLYIVNLQWTPKDECANVKIHGKCDEVMKQVMRMLGVQVASYQREMDPLFEHCTPLFAEEIHTTSQPVLLVPEKKEIKIKEEIEEIIPPASIKPEPPELQNKPSEIGSKLSYCQPKSPEMLTKSPEMLPKSLESLPTKLPDDFLPKSSNFLTKSSEILPKSEMLSRSPEFLSKPSEFLSKPSEFLSKPPEIKLQPTPNLKPSTFTIENILAAGTTTTRPNFLHNHHHPTNTTTTAFLNYYNYTLPLVSNNTTTPTTAGATYADFLFYPIHTNLLYSGLQTIINTPAAGNYDCEENQAPIDYSVATGAASLKSGGAEVPFLPAGVKLEVEDDDVVVKSEGEVVVKSEVVVVKSEVTVAPPVCGYCRESCGTYTCQFYVKSEVRFEGGGLYCVCCTGDGSSEEEEKNGDVKKNSVDAKKNGDLEENGDDAKKNGDVGKNGDSAEKNCDLEENGDDLVVKMNHGDLFGDPDEKMCLDDEKICLNNDKMCLDNERASSLNDNPDNENNDENMCYTNGESCDGDNKDESNKAGVKLVRNSDCLEETPASPVEKLGRIQPGWFGKGYKKYKRSKRRYPSY